MCKEKKPIYDPVHDHVQGVDDNERRRLIEEFYAGDPIPKPEPSKIETISIFPGIKLVRTTRSK